LSWGRSQHSGCERGLCRRLSGFPSFGVLSRCCASLTSCPHRVDGHHPKQPGPVAWQLEPPVGIAHAVPREEARARGSVITRCVVHAGERRPRLTRTRAEAALSEGAKQTDSRSRHKCRSRALRCAGSRDPVQSDGSMVMTTLRPMNGRKTSISSPATERSTMSGPAFRICPVKTTGFCPVMAGPSTVPMI
jgi:hypothetical protein